MLLYKKLVSFYFCQVPSAIFSPVFLVSLEFLHCDACCEQGFFSSSASGLPLIFVMYSAVLSSLGTSLIIFLTCSSVHCTSVACGAMQGNNSQY